MLDPSRVLVFALAVAVLTITPGPSSLYIITRGVSEGRRSAVVSALGVETADFLHVGAAVVGVSALIASSAVAISTVKYLGGAYLIYLGVRTLRSQPAAVTAVDLAPQAAPTGLRRVYWQGFVVNALNPKAALFFVAFLPQFVDPGSGSVSQQILLLGVVFVIVAAAFDMLYAVLAGSLGVWLRRRPTFLRRQRYASGAVYIGLGVAAAATGEGRTAA